jgi:proline iminopeptidase
MPTSARDSLFPEIQPYHHDLLDVDPTHRVYFEECGNPLGEPVIFLHGGPGSGCNPNQRRFFDPKHYRIILMDQRGCGRSKPEGEVINNTTDDLISDLEKLRTHLSIPRWHIFGGSWGSTLALVYACRHAEVTRSLVLRGIFLSRQLELDWFLGNIQHFFPESWERLCNYLPASERSTPLLSYESLIFSSNTDISIPAAIQWNAYESSIMSLLPKSSTNEVNGIVELARARVQIHYIKHHCFIGDRDLLKEAKEKLKTIPTIIIQGRYDMVCPPITAWELSQALPHAQFIMVPDAGHSALEDGICRALVTATEQFKNLS